MVKINDKMKEDVTKALLQKSTIHTSDDFTDRLVQKIKEQQLQPSTVSQIQSLLYPIAAVIIGGIVFFAAVLFDALPKIQVFNFQVQLNKTPLLILLAVLLLFGVNHLLKLQATLTHLQKR